MLISPPHHTGTAKCSGHEMSLHHTHLLPPSSPTYMVPEHSSQRRDLMPSLLLPWALGLFSVFCNTLFLVTFCTFKHILPTTFNLSIPVLQISKWSLFILSVLLINHFGCMQMPAKTRKIHETELQAFIN